MSRKEQAARLLLEGKTPSEIAQELNTRPPEVMQALCTSIGEGGLRRSDVAFSLPRQVRDEIERLLEDRPNITFARLTETLHKGGVQADRFDLRVYLKYRNARVVLGDMYEMVRNIEVRLHTFVKRAFIAEYGEENWWRGGVPDRIRADCAALLEKDPEPAAEPYCYTHLIALREVLDKGWGVLSRYLPPGIAGNKKDLMERLLRLNRIRNAVMHPVRGDQLSEEEFEFVRMLEHVLGPLPVSTPTAAPLDEGEPSSAPVQIVSKLTAVPEVSAPPEEAVTQEQAS